MPKDLITTFREFVAREQLFTKHDKLLLACSGGLDSTVLAHVLHAEGYDIVIAHMNFQLRGEDSDGDTAFVEELARTLDAKFYCKAVDVKARAQPGESTQMTCRRLRYEWFFELAPAEENMRLILTAHHAEDNLETALINLIRGTGISGIAGIMPKYENLCRPLLEVSKEAILAFAKAQNLTWREDVSNDTDVYLRNKVRHHLTPLLKNSFNLTTDGWIKTAQNFRSDDFVHKVGIQSLIDEYVTKLNGQTVINKRLTTKLALKALVYALGSNYGFTREQIRQIHDTSGSNVFDSLNYRAYVSPDHIGFEFCIDKSEAKALEPIEVFQFPFTGDVSINIDFYFDLIPRPTSLDQPGVLYLAPPTLPLHLRPRKNGDRFQPLGMGGKTKKIKDYMIDAKIPVWLRDRIYLLTNDQDEIMAIPGYCISEKFKVQPEDEMVLEITTLP